MSAPAKFITPPPPRPPSAFESMLTGVGEANLTIAGLILGLYLFLVLLKFLWKMV